MSKLTQLTSAEAKNRDRLGFHLEPTVFGVPTRMTARETQVALRTSNVSTKAESAETAQGRKGRNAEGYVYSIEVVCLHCRTFGTTLLNTL